MEEAIVIPLLAPVLYVCLRKRNMCSSSLSLCLCFFLLDFSFHPQPDVFGHLRCKRNAGKRRKDSSKGIWLVLIWKYCFTSSELNYWSELAVLGEQAERHRQPRWARSGRQICHRDHGKHMNLWSVELCSWPFIQRIKSGSSLLLLASDLYSGATSLQENPEVLRLFSPSLSCFLPSCGLLHV